MGLTKPIEQNLLSYQGTFMYLNILYEEDILMKSVKKHIIISTVLCALTLAVLIAFSGKLPESVPVHFDSAGNANSFWPRNVVVFGVPAFCVLLNLIVDAVLSQHENKKTYMFYIMPVVAFAVTGIMIYLGMK